MKLKSFGCFAALVLFAMAIPGASMGANRSTMNGSVRDVGSPPPPMPSNGSVRDVGSPPPPMPSNGSVRDVGSPPPPMPVV
jgi:hypothetical protein